MNGCYLQTGALGNLPVHPHNYTDHCHDHSGNESPGEGIKHLPPESNVIVHVCGWGCQP